MARLAERLPENVPGDFYVDRTRHRAESPSRMRRELAACTAWMKRAA